MKVILIVITTDSEMILGKIVHMTPIRLTFIVTDTKLGNSKWFRIERATVKFK